MTDPQPITTGVDVYVASGAPASNYEGSRRVLAKNPERRTLIKMPIVIPAGRTVLSAVLSGVARVTFPSAGSITATALASSWTPSKVTWNNQPATTGPGYDTPVPAVVAGQRCEVDVTELVQALALGQPNYGWRLSTDIAAGIDVQAFDYGGTTWQLAIEVSDIPAAPATLTPQGKVSLAKWVARVEDYETVAAIQVRVDADRTAPYDFESLEVATSAPELDLATTTFAGLADGATTYSQARVKTIDGFWSEWSDWVEINRSTQPVPTMSDPAGPMLYDPTPTVAASLAPAGTADTRWQVIVKSLSDLAEVLYDSGDDIAGATLSHTNPLRWNGQPLSDADGDYRIIVRAWDSPERVPSFGDPTYVEVVRDLTLDVDGTPNPPTTLVAEQSHPGSPRVQLTWTRGGASPDRFVIRRNGVNIEVVDAADVLVSTGTWQWVDETAPPHESATYTVRAIDTGSPQSADSPGATITPDVTGVWLLSDYGDVLLYGDEVKGLRQGDKRETLERPFYFEDLDIITAVRGFEGSYEGSIDNRGEQDVDAARKILEEIRQRSYNPVRLVWATQSIRVYLRGLSVAPSPEIFPSSNREHDVSFECFETRDD